jgi:hypothetical protein
LDGFKDWKIWVHMFITIFVYMVLYSFLLFLPTTIKDLSYGYNPKVSHS